MHKAKYTAAACLLAAAAMTVSACGRNENKNAASPAPTAAASPAATAAVSPSPAAGASPGAAASPAAGTGTTTANAEALYKQNCTACHGEALDGRGAANKNLQHLGSKYSADQIAGIITNGRNSMPAFKGRLQDTDIKALSDWLAAKK